MSALQHSLGTGLRLGSSTSCKHTVMFGNSLLVLPCCTLPARPARSLRSLHHSTTAMGRRGLAELISVGKQRRCVTVFMLPLNTLHLYPAPVCFVCSMQRTCTFAYPTCRDPGRELLKPGHLSPMLEVPEHIQRPPYVGTGENPWIETIQVHNREVGALFTSSCITVS